jgi:hypothetical protein
MGAGHVSEYLGRNISYNYSNLEENGTIILVPSPFISSRVCVQKLVTKLEPWDPIDIFYK